jgi:hypothetical protein
MALSCEPLRPYKPFIRALEIYFQILWTNVQTILLGRCMSVLLACKLRIASTSSCKASQQWSRTTNFNRSPLISSMGHLGTYSNFSRAERNGWHAPPARSTKGTVISGVVLAAHQINGSFTVSVLVFSSSMWHCVAISGLDERADNPQYRTEYASRSTGQHIKMYAYPRSQSSLREVD